MNYSSTHPAQRQIKKEEENISNYKNPIRSSRSAEKKKKDFLRHIRHLFHFLNGYVVLNFERRWQKSVIYWNWVNWLRIFQFLDLPLMWYQSYIRTQSAVISYRFFFFLVFTTHKHLRIALLFSYSFIDLKKSTKKFAYKSYFFHDSRTAVTLRSSHPASQRGVSGMFLSLFSFYLFIPPGGYLSRKEGDGRI